ncbi:MAG: hypothetical protein E7353_02305 [Clostridiales bacterium]|nr:hypothetical protein [Clostridiales bacterium]
MLGAILGGMLIGGIVSSCAGRSRANKQIEIIQANDRKLKKQVEFYDEFRELDSRLARNVREGYKGITYLIKGLEVSHYNYDLINKLKNIRNYRGRLSHDRKKWRDIPEPSRSLMNDLMIAKDWVDDNFITAGKLVYKGKKAFENKNNRYYDSNKSSRSTNYKRKY